MTRIITSEKGKHIDQLTHSEYTELMSYVQGFRLLTNRLVLTEMEVEFGAYMLIRKRNNQSSMIDNSQFDVDVKEDWDDWKGWSELHDGD